MGAQAAAVSVANTQTTYPANPQFTATFEPTRWNLSALSTDGAGQVFVSFDGVSDHGVLIPGASAAASGARTGAILLMLQHFSRLWLRVSGAAVATVIAVNAES